METDVPFSVIAGTDVVPSLLGHFSLSAARPRLHVCHTEHARHVCPNCYSNSWLSLPIFAKADTIVPFDSTTR